MSTLERSSRNPFSEILDWLDLNRPTSSDLAPFIPVEQYAEEGAFVIRADLPGIDPDKDVEVKVEGDMLTVSGQRRETEQTKQHSEVRYGSFTRSIRLPRGSRADQVTATYDSGVLVVKVPMSEPAESAVTVPVQRAGG